jgi:CelD/BcsL family acetyltransferase involved in cellulose biosynthesis
MQVRVLSGPGALDELAEPVDDLHAAVGAPLMARRPWLDTWIASYREYRPVAVVIETGGRLAGAAMLAERGRRLARFVALGHGPSDAAALAAADHAAADALAAAVSDYLGRLDRPWQLTLRHLPAGDRVAAGLARTLPRAVIAPGAVSPVLRVGDTRTLRAHVSRNHHQQIRRLRNRLDRDRIDPSVAQLRDPDGVHAVLPEVVEVCRARDQALGRRSAMDDPAAGAFFRRVVLSHARLGLVVLTTLRIGGRLAAYVLCFVDGAAYRMWHSRFHPDWSRYGVGLLAHDAALEYALEHGCELYDWGRGEEAYKSSLSNEQVQGEDLRAWSGPFVAVPGRLFLRAKELAARGERRGGATERAVDTARRVLDRVRT